MKALSILALSSIALSLGTLAARDTLALSRQEQTFERYQPILDREPFGAPAAAPEPAPITPAGPPPESFVPTIQLNAIVETSGGLRVGFTHLKSNRNFFLAVGDSDDGYEVLDADYESEKALIRKDGEEQWVTMGAGAAMATTAPETPSAIARALAARRGRASAYAARRDEREAPPPAPAPEPPKPQPPKPTYTPEEMNRHLEAYQMDVIRQGLPPLPIPLTPEMDAQLVSEGVLPPPDQAEEPEIPAQ